MNVKVLIVKIHDFIFDNVMIIMVVIFGSFSKTCIHDDGADGSSFL